jgi:hypothetical protein
MVACKPSSTTQISEDSANRRVSTPTPRLDSSISQQVDLSTHVFSDVGVERKTDETRNVLSAVHDIVVGRKIAHGMIVRFGSGTASLHMRNTEVKRILESVRASGAEIAECIEKYQLVQGISPSRNAFRVMALVLQKLSPRDSDSRRELKALCDEALAIDLSAPQQKGWRREIGLQLSGVDTRLTVSLVPLSSMYRLGARAFAVDLPLEDRSHRFGYRLEMRPQQPSKNTVWSAIGGRVRQAMALAGACAPMAATMVAMTYAPLADVIPRVSANPSVQGAVGGIAEFLVVVGVGVASYFSDQYFVNRKIMGRSAH